MEVKYRKTNNGTVFMADVCDVSVWCMGESDFCVMKLSTNNDFKPALISNGEIDYGYGWKRLTNENMEYHARQINNLIAMEKL